MVGEQASWDVPFAGTNAKRTILWIIVGLVVASFIGLDLLFALRP